MDLDLYPSWVMRKAVVLEVVWVPDEVFTSSEIAKIVPPPDLVLYAGDILKLRIFILSLC